MDFGGIGVESIVIVAILIAVVAFFYSNLGLGGGQLYVPIMDLFFASLVISEVIPLSLCLAFVTMLGSTYSHGRKHLVDFKLGIQLALAGIIGAIAGVLFTTNVDEDVIKGSFATMLVIVATKMMYDIYARRKDHATSPTEHKTRLIIAGMGVSIITGFFVGSFGIGGGVVSVPLIIYVFKFEPRKAIGTSALLGAILTPVAFVAYALNRSVSEGFEIPYDIVLILTPIVLVFALVGSRWGLEKLKTKMVKTIFTCGVYVAAAEMIYSILFT